MISLELSSDEAKRLISAVKSGELEEYGVVDAKVKEHQEKPTEKDILLLDTTKAKVKRFSAEKDKSRTQSTSSRGKVKSFNVVEGYGFIKPDDGSKDVFVHWMSVDDLGGNEGLEVGEVVEYDVKLTSRGPMAQNVNRIKRFHFGRG